MGSEKRILVVVDPTAAEQPAVGRAAWLAKQMPSRIELFICDQLAATPRPAGANPPLLAEARSQLAARHLRRLETLAEPLRAAGLQVAVDARVDSPLHAGIVRKVVESGATLVLKDTHYLAPLRRSLFSNTDWNLIRLCPATLWLVKPRPLSVTPCIIAAVDPLHEHDKPAELDTKIVVAAAELAAATGGDVQLFHGVDVTPLVAAYGDGLPIPAPLPLYDLTEILRNEHREAVLGFAKEHGISSGRVHVAQGAVGSSLIALADEMRADVVVMGAISRSGLKRLFIGNTAETVLDRLSCDLLLVKPSVMPPDVS